MGENKHIKSDLIIESIMYRTYVSTPNFLEYVKVHPNIFSGASFARHSNQIHASKEVMNVLSHTHAHP